MRTIVGEVGQLLNLTMLEAAGSTLLVGDLCSLDTTANWTVRTTVNDTVPLGRVVAVSADAEPGSGARLVTVEIFRYRAVVALPTDAAIAVGVSIQTNGAGTNNIETVGSWAGTLVISDPGAAGTAYVLV